MATSVSAVSHARNAGIEPGPSHHLIMTTTTRIVLHILTLIVTAGAAGATTGLLHMGPLAGGIAGATVGVVVMAIDPFRIIRRP